MSTPKERDAVAEYVDQELHRNGVASINLADGQIFYFTADLLAQLLIKANGNDAGGRAAIFVQRSVKQ